MNGNDWWTYKTALTVIDVLDSGACLDGVCKWVEAHGGRIAGRTKSYWKQRELSKAANGDGSGYGSGYGDGSGDGSGSGYGSGYGYGYGYGYGDGDGDGYGYGYGDIL